MEYKSPAWACALLLALCAPAAHAARPMTADDAAILDAQQCQLETWWQRGRAQHEYWAVAGCRAGANWELAAGGAYLHARGDADGDRAAMLQAKTLLRAPQGDGWALGMVLANQFRPGGSLHGDLSVNLPLSVELDGEHLLAHANLGWLRQRGQRAQPTWALGLELAAWERGAVTLEGYGRSRGGSYLQLGARYSLIPGRADIDVSYGERVGRRDAERYLAIGLTLAASLAR